MISFDVLLFTQYGPKLIVLYLHICDKGAGQYKQRPVFIWLYGNAPTPHMVPFE